MGKLFSVQSFQGKGATYYFINSYYDSTFSIPVDLFIKLILLNQMLTLQEGVSGMDINKE